MEQENTCCNDGVREAICVETKKIYDSCRDRDCLEDLRVFLSPADQATVDTATSVKARNAEIVWVTIDVEPLGFNRGYYQVDIHYYFKMKLEVYGVATKPLCMDGFAFYDKRAVMYGSDGNARIFSSRYIPSGADVQNCATSNAPEVSVEVVEPVILGGKLVEASCEPQGCGSELPPFIPQPVVCSMDGTVVTGGEKLFFISLGIFTIIRLCRNVQMLIPSYDFCIPEKESQCGGGETPCELFKKFKFPVEEFFPPKAETEDASSCF